jgi:acetoin utilization deacetylase AcuC-like enzyme
MTTTGIVTHPACIEHFAGPGHPERPERLTEILRALREAPSLQACAWLEAPRAKLEEIAAAHSPTLAAQIEAACERGRALLDEGDTYVSSESYEAALRAAGASVAACENVLRGTWSNAFVAVRPPGHHAEESTAMGFCLFNNVAIAARWLRASGVARVAIVDFDVHHGNGTQHIFERDASVFYASLHQYPHYPGTGAASERGQGDGVGATLNCPLASGSGDREWTNALESLVLRELEQFEPEFLLVSAGFDAHRDDPLSGTVVTTDGYRALSTLLADFARGACQGRVVSVLEGGYDLNALAESARVHVEVLADSA